MIDREPNIGSVLAQSDPGLLAQELAAATGLRTTIVHEGPIIDGDDPLAGAKHAAKVALERFFPASEDGFAPGGDR